MRMRLYVRSSALSHGTHAHTRTQTHNHVRNTHTHTHTQKQGSAAAALTRRCGQVNAALDAVGRVLRGQDLLTVPVRNVATALAAGTVPEPWSDKWEGPESPPIWLQAVVKKKVAIDAWLDSVERGQTLALPVYPSNMFNPSVFLNALRQQVLSAWCTACILSPLYLHQHYFMRYLLVGAVTR